MQSTPYLQCAHLHVLRTARCGHPMLSCSPTKCITGTLTNLNGQFQLYFVRNFSNSQFEQHLRLPLFLAVTGKLLVLETIKMYNCTTHSPTWGSMVLDAYFSVYWRFIDAVRTLLCSSRAFSIYRCYIEDAIAISYVLGNPVAETVMGCAFSCPCSDVQLSWVLDSDLNSYWNPRL